MSALSIAGHEIRRLLRDRALPILLVLLLALGAYAAWNGRVWVDQRETAIGLIKVEEQQTRDRSRVFVGKAPSVLPRAQPVLPPTAMAPLSIGQADAYPYTADVVALGDPTQLLKHVWADIGNPAARAAGRFDLAFVIVFLLPLVVLVATYDLWSRERERGIAALVLSQPVAVAQLLVVKVLARGVVVLLPALAIILVVAAWSGARSAAGLAMLALTVLAYGGFWLALALLIGCFARRTTEAAISAGALWLLIVVMAPSMTLAAVNLIAPPPSQMRFATEVKATLADISKRQQREHLAHPAPLRSPPPVIPDAARQAYADRVAADRELAPLIASHAQAEAARRRLLDRVRLLLPSVAAQDALDRIAGSDADRALAFQQQVDAFWQARRLLHQGYLDRDAPQTLDEYEALPHFQFHEAAGVAQRGVLADLAALIIGTLIVLVAAGALRGRLATP
ncbi:ABC transporter permease subunit [Stenotrophomonas maltophilia]|uniref:Multi-copper enzyme maturase ABC-type transport system permease component-like protein n=1 Tax=Stenotrophomonas maltophilia (strain R551-3) TaxID=391008 RepID=B4SJJ8_STRM5|nr:ABC transporter permease subunit [Stenotrophomonas maltophilia]ACF51753.1 multi-copper enzyme maturase ABC-type transport system permease component-like protein [Stenotrophomonas maltophilia R551-3]